MQTGLHFPTKGQNLMRKLNCRENYALKVLGVFVLMFGVGLSPLLAQDKTRVVNYAAMPDWYAAAPDSEGRLRFRAYLHEGGKYRNHLVLTCELKSSFIATVEFVPPSALKNMLLKRAQARLKPTQFVVRRISNGAEAIYNGEFDKIGGFYDFSTEEDLLQFLEMMTRNVSIRWSAPEFEYGHFPESITIGNPDDFAKRLGFERTEHNNVFIDCLRHRDSK
jgi:hypothetical protein